jgi:hypothetical protein
MMDGFTSLEEDQDDVILCKSVETGLPPSPLCSGVIEGYNTADVAEWLDRRLK